MKTLAVKLPRKRFFKLRGDVVELAVGLLAMSILQSQAAQAETLVDADAPPGAAPGAAESDAAIPEQMANLDPDAIRSIPIDELKALLDAKALAMLGLGADFMALFDTEPSTAVRKLEAAFREKIKAAHHGDAKIAAIGDDARVGADHHDAQGEGHHESSLVGDFSPIWLLAGLAVVGGGIVLASGGSSNSDQAAPVANTPPVATADAVTTLEDTPVTFDVRTNDRDANGGTLSVTQINGTAITTTTPVAITGGSISVGSDGRLTFTPSPNYNGTPTFTYTLSDGQGGSATATVALTVTAANDAPVAAADSFTTAEDNAVTIAVLANDTDADGDTLRVTQVNGTAISITQAVAVTGGSVVLNAAGNIVFTPTPNYNGSPSFTYTVADATGATATATVSGTVTAVNDAPVNALPASAPVAVQGLSLALTGLSVSDVDVGSATITTTLSVRNGVLTTGTVQGGASGTGSGTASIVLTGTLAQINATLGAISYTASPTFVGTDTLTFVTSDGQSSDTDTLSLLVSQVTTGVVIDGYVAGAQIFFDVNGNGAYDEGEVVATTDANGRFTLVGAAQGTMIAIGGTNTDTGLPNIIALKAPAGSSAVTPLTTIMAELVETGLSVEAANAQVLRAFGLPAGLNLISFNFLSADSDPDLAFTVQKIATQIATLLIQATEAGISSTAIGEQLATLTGSGAIITLGDPAQLRALLESAGLTPASAEQAALATASINQAIAASTSPAQLVGTVRDLNQPNVNLPPITIADTGVFGIGVPAIVNVLANDSDLEGAALRVTAIDGQPISLDHPVEIANGTVSLGANGTLSFVPNTVLLGSQSFTYTVSDEQGGTASGTVTTSLAAPVLPVSADQVHFIADHAAELAAQGVTTIDAVGDVVSLNEGEAQSLIAAGIDFAEADTVTMSAEGTHLSTTLKGLQSLHIDSVAVGAGITVLAIQAGGGLDTISAADLPSFTIAQSDAALDITLNVDAGTLDPSFDLSSLASVLNGVGVDHIGVSGVGDLGVSLGQATGMAAAGIDFAPAAEVVLHLSASEVGNVADDPSLVANLHIDSIDVQNDLAVITDTQAGNLIDAGLHFAEADSITVGAEGTHLSTSLRGLHDLKVDSIAVAAGIATLHVDAGDLTGLSATDLPQFDIAQSDEALDVTLRVDMDEFGELARLAQALADAGIDHIAINQDPATLTGDDAAEAADITARTGIDFSYENFTTDDMAATSARAYDEASYDEASYQPEALYRELISAFESVDDHGTGGSVELVDGAASSLAEAGMLRAYTADTLVVDATGSGDKLLTTLKEVADLGVDEVRLADQHGSPVYVELGIEGDADAVNEIKALIASLDHGSAGPNPLFTGTEKVALVMDADAAQALAHVDGALDQLASLGITEVDVLAGPGETAPAFGDTGIEVKIIGQDDDLYRHLHHDR